MSSDNSKRLLLLTLLLALLSLTQSTTTLYYNFPALTNGTYEKPSYPLGYIDGNTTITIILNQLDKFIPLDTSSATVDIQLRDATNVNVIHDFSSGTPTCAAGSISCNLEFQVPSSGFYYVSVVSNSNVEELYVMRYELTVLVENTIVLRLTDVYRQHVLKYLYIAENITDAKFSIYPVTNSSSAYLELFAIDNNYIAQSFIPGQFKVLNQVNFLNQTQVGATETYTADLTPGFYFVRVVVVGNFTSIVRLTYQSDAYACPYDPNYVDYYSDFQGCNQPLSQQGLPCLTYNQITGICSSCIQGYYLQNGQCFYNTTCPARNYLQSGQCLPVSATCDSFDYFTGYCLNCTSNNYTLNADGTCTTRVPTCTDRQWIFNFTCQNVSSTCGYFDPLTGNCLTCINANYYIVNNSCVLVPIICEAGQYVTPNRTCANIPLECNNFNATSQICLGCVNGYFLLGGACQRPTCPARHVPSQYGLFCVNVSPLCATWDPITGHCLTCLAADQSVNSDGVCTQFSSPLAGCMERQKLGFGACQNASQNCAVYNLITQNCDTCNPGYYLNYQGICALSAPCKSNQWSVNGMCFDIPNNCLAIDSNGYCTLCISNAYRIQSGQCIYYPSCAPQQYLNVHGICVDVSPACATFNPTDGTCITCVAAGTQPNQGVCCPVGQTYNNGVCVNAAQLLLSSQSSVGPVCLARHPSLGYCLKCNPGFTVDQITLMVCVPSN